MNDSLDLWRPAYVGIGSNLDGPSERVEHAFAAIRCLPDSGFFAHSGLYRSAPMGPQDQPDFLNAAAAFLTRLDAHDLLRRLQEIETSEGRNRQGERWGPRSLDLDLLVLGRLSIDDERLCLPHPRIAERNFVLLPLADIAPHLYVPGQGSVAWLLANIGTTDPRIEKIGQEEAGALH